MSANKTSELLKMLGKQTPTADAPPGKPANAAAGEIVRESVPARAKPTQKRAPQPQKAVPAVMRGRGVHLWFHEADEKLIRELSVWLHTQRPRINDSLVIKAVLRAAKTGPGLLAGYDEAVKIDGRKRPAKT